MKTRLLHHLMLLLALAISGASLAADASALIQKLAAKNETERAAAIAELRKMGNEAREILLKTEANEPLEQQQLLLVRRLLGELLISQNQLKPLDPKLLALFGADKEKGAPGNPHLRFNKDKKYIVLDGEFALEQGPLEYLVVTRGPNARLHETVAAVYPRPRDICWALLACAYTYAGELGEDGQVNLPRDAGVMISLEFLWETPHAAMEPGGLDAATLIAALKHKQALLEKAGEQERATILFDMENDVGFLRRLIGYDIKEDASGKVLEKSPFADDWQDDIQIGDDARRKVLLDALQQYLQRHPPEGAAAKPPVLPEKKLVRVPIEYFAWNTQTAMPMRRAPFAFTGSKFEKDPVSKKMIFRADEEKSIVALKLDPYAVLNTPLDTRAIDPQHAAGYGLNRYVVPRRGAKCRVVFEPWVNGEIKDGDFVDTGDKNAKPAPPPVPQQ